MDTNNINNGIANINNIELNNIWAGSAAQAKIGSLEGLVADLNKCVADVSMFNGILALRDRYIEVCDEISRLDGLIRGCRVDHSDPDSSCSCGYYASQIQALEAERKELRITIIDLLGRFEGITPEVENPADLTSYDEEPGAFNGEFPLFNQEDYPDTPFGGGTIASSGCALTCAAMVISAYTGQTITPEYLATNFPYVQNNQTTMNHMLAAFGIKSANSNALTEEAGMKSPIAKYDAYVDGGFTEFADDPVLHFDDAMKRLEEGYACAFFIKGDNPNGYMVTQGHYILATGITEDGKILINDPYGPSYNKGHLKDGFENGFDPSVIQAVYGGGYLIESYDDYSARQNEEDN